MAVSDKVKDFCKELNEFYKKEIEPNKVNDDFQYFFKFLEKTVASINMKTLKSSDKVKDFCNDIDDFTKKEIEPNEVNDSFNYFLRFMHKIMLLADMKFSQSAEYQQAVLMRMNQDTQQKANAINKRLEELDNFLIGKPTPQPSNAPQNSVPLNAEIKPVEVSQDKPEPKKPQGPQLSEEKKAQNEKWRKEMGIGKKKIKV